jgi:hypothetical protein
MPGFGLDHLADGAASLVVPALSAFLRYADRKPAATSRLSRGSSAATQTAAATL